jgi:hypothetical protein
MICSNHALATEKEIGGTIDQAEEHATIFQAPNLDDHHAVLVALKLVENFNFVLLLQHVLF